MKYVINNFIINQNEINIDNYMDIAGCVNDTICYENVLKDTNLSINNYTIFTKLTTSIYNDKQSDFIFIVIIYGGCLISSIILYSIFSWIYTRNEKDDKECKEKYCKECCNNDSYRVCEICGFVFYCEDKSMEDYKEPSCCCCCWECIKLTCCNGFNCLCMILYSLGFYLLNLLCCCCIKDDKGDECCNDYKESPCYFYDKYDYEKKHQCFCYCYESNRWQKYIYKYLTSDVQITVFPYLIEYFILKLMTSAFEKQYLNFEEKKEFQNSNNTNNTNFKNLTNLLEFTGFLNEANNFTDSTKDNDENNIFSYKEYILTYIIFIGTFVCYFYFTLTFQIIIKIVYQGLNIKNKNKSSISNRILEGLHGILIFDGLYALIFSSIYLTNNEHYFFKNRNFYLIPILMNKFYYFTLNYFCIN